MKDGSSALTIVLLLLASAAGADEAWRVRVGATRVIADDGGFDAVRPNGKRVRTEISSGTGFELEGERLLTPRFGVVLGLLARSRHSLEIHQDFPDGTGFRSSDETSFAGVEAGGALHLTPGRSLDVYLQAHVVRAWFDDLVFASAGPPWDRSAPLELHTSPAFGGGMTAGMDWHPGSGRIGVTAGLGFLVVGLRGPFTSMPEGEGDLAGDLDLDFNPVVARFGISLRL